MAGVAMDITERKEAEEALRFQKILLEAQSEASLDGILVVSDTDRRVISHNRRFLEMWGISEEVIATHSEEAALREITHKLADPNEFLEGIVYLLGHPEEKSHDEILLKDGRTFERYSAPLRTADGAGGGRVFYFRDVTERKEAEEALKQGEAQLAEAQRIAHVGSWEWDVALNTVVWSDELYRIFGLTPEEFENTYESFVRYVHPEDRQFVQKTIQEAYETGQPFALEHRLVRPDGGVRVLHTRGEVFTDENGERVRMTGISQDVTERKRMEEQLQHLAFHDQLTDLPNRQLFMDRLGHALERTRRRRNGKVAVLFMDLDDFKVVNDSLGHGVGNMLLVAVAERLVRCLRPEDTVARFGGDEFVVLLEDVENPEDALRVAERITQELRRPFTLEGWELGVSASIGISVGEARTKAPEDLVRDADTAMYRAKEEGSGYKVFDPAMYERAMDRMELESDLRSAIELEELVVHYQPIINLQTGQLWGLEALVRWEHPERGLLNPDEFVPVAEETGLIVPLGEWVLKEACRQAREWQDDYPDATSLAISVNLSARQFQHAEFPKAVARVLEETGLEPRQLDLEITETTAMEAPLMTALTVEELRNLGVRVTIDDFGTEYSSLSYLERFPVDHLKIDRSFVARLSRQFGTTVLVSAIIDLAHALGLKVIAEGVETEEQVTLLKGMGCDFAQGYYFSEPLDPAEMARFTSR